jgi:hypothetical protein
MLLGLAPDFVPWCNGQNKEEPVVQPPTTISLLLCDLVIVDQATRKISLVNTFSGIRTAEFPFVPLPFCVFAILTDGEGDAEISLTVTRLETDEEIYTFERTVHFPDRLTEVQILFRVTGCCFPAAGEYLFTLLVDREWVAQHRIQVYARESDS